MVGVSSYHSQEVGESSQESLTGGLLLLPDFYPFKQDGPGRRAHVLNYPAIADQMI